MDLFRAVCHLGGRRVHTSRGWKLDHGVTFTAFLSAAFFSINHTFHS